MRAVTWQGLRKVSVEKVPDPVIREPGDAIIRITSTTLCGSDLHLCEALAPFLHRGDVLGHECMGIVVEAGQLARSHVSPGDRVVIPFTISCGHCWMCRHGLYAQCETTQNADQGTGAALFGYSSLYGRVPGGQAEYLRVPQAQFGPIKVPEGPPDDRFVYLSDVLPTAWQAARYANIPAGGVAAVYGLGAVGQFAARCALLLGAGRVFGVDFVPERLAMARRHGIEVIDASEVDDVPGYLRDETDGRGPHGVIDAVGMEANGNPVARLGQNAAASLPRPLARKVALGLSADPMHALLNAINSVCRGGTVSISGVYGGARDRLPMMTMFDKGVQLRMGQCHVKRWIDEIMPYLEDQADPLGTEDMASHYLPLEDASRGYELFGNRADGCTKVMLQPDRTEPEVFPGGAEARQKAAARLRRTAGR